ncbi:MAG: hypothetical protein Tsb0021_01840 [Chlamydiales bacterium]
MEKQKPWHLYLIIAVMVMTLYSILPTIFYYSKPLRQPIDSERAYEVAEESIARVNTLEDKSVAWLHSFNKMLGIKAKSIEFNLNRPHLITVDFSNQKDVAVFKRFLPVAGASIPFVPAQLKLYPEQSPEHPHRVYVQRSIGIHIDPTDAKKYFLFSNRFEKNHDVTPTYLELVHDRALEVAKNIAGPSLQALQTAAVVDHPTDKRFDDTALSLAREIVDTANTFGVSDSIAKRYFSSFSQSDRPDRTMLIDQLAVRFGKMQQDMKQQLSSLANEEQNAEIAEKRDLLREQEETLGAALRIIKEHNRIFKEGLSPLDEERLALKLDNSFSSIDKGDYIQTLDLKGYHPFINGILIDWNDAFISLRFYDDVQKIRNQEGGTEWNAIVRDKLNQKIFNDIALISSMSDESIAPSGDTFRINLEKLTNSQSFLAFKLGELASTYAHQMRNTLESAWKPSYSDLIGDVYPVRTYQEYRKESPEDQKLGLVVYSPASQDEAPPKGFHENSIYVIAKGLESILSKYQDQPDSDEAKVLTKDVQALQQLLQNEGFIAYPGSVYGIASEFSKDYIFELSDYYSDFIKATREDFYVKGSKRYAVLDFTDVEQRILAKNQIQDRIQEDLVKWNEEYAQAQVSLDPATRYLVPPPTQNAYWQNLKLSVAKYFRGDSRKILNWGLDLSGGKTVRIGLVDQNNRRVTEPEDLKQASNELYTRINKMGVSERTIRTENETIILDFPGSQAFSAAELVKASAMYFHIVNEKFGPWNKELAEVSNRFLQEVWNEAVVTNRKDIESINEIAWRHMGGDITSEEVLRPRSETAKTLYAQGLRLANPRLAPISQVFDDSTSSVAMFRGDDPSEWQGQTHPLMFVFRNYALEGSNLEGIQVGYDQSEGNTLIFSVKGSYEGGKDKGLGNPREDFYAWTSQFAKEKIAGTPKSEYSRGKGWRMAVILNGRIVSAPTLEGALRDHASIHGRFTQREINQLAADLKAGSLSYTPRILSEQNISPELGKEERTRGIIASLIAIALVAAAMIGYYRFAGLVAFCAVMINLLIIWAALQSIGAALTLPGIAGIVLTIGMAVDANVLVFERIREEFSASGRIASAIQAGYRKAFSAIVDSNITTIMAALILIQFDSGPIKGFALTLIIGITSSMFTSLFMTRYFFAGWVKNPKHKELKMSHLIGNTNIPFLKMAPKVIIASLVVMVLGCYLLVDQRHTLLGMDFTGGYSLTANLEEKPGTNYRTQAIEAFIKAGASQSDIEVQELSRPNQLRIQMGMSMEEPGHPFYGLPQEVPAKTATFNYETNPRINWVVNALEEQGLNFPESSLENLQNDWSVMSGQLSDTMRNNALIALSLALVGILVYITFRFEFKYAIAAVIALLHDVVITLGIAAFFHYLNFPIQIDLEVIGAVMTIIGYSLNDTIIVFDRIREEVYLNRKLKITEIIDHALNVTLSRTIMTSGTTLLVLLALVLFGGPAIFGFSLVMTIGVLVGTISSLFVAAPTMLFFHNRELKQHEASHAS